MIFHKNIILSGGRVLNTPRNWIHGFKDHRHPARIYYMRRGSLEISWATGSAQLESPFMYWVPSLVDSFNIVVKDFAVDFLHVDDALLRDFPNKDKVFSFSRLESDYWDSEWEDALSNHKGQIRSHEGLQEMLSSLTRRLQRESSLLSPSPQQKKLQSLLEEIDLHPEQKLSLAQMSEKVHLSVGHFSRLFKDVMGVSPQSYQRTRLMNLVLSHISSGDSLKQVSKNLNYSSPFALSRDFKKHFGVCPRDHLRRYGQHP